MRSKLRDAAKAGCEDLTWHTGPSRMRWRLKSGCAGRGSAGGGTTEGNSDAAQDGAIKCTGDTGSHSQVSVDARLQGAPEACLNFDWLACRLIRSK